VSRFKSLLIASLIFAAAAQVSALYAGILGKKPGEAGFTFLRLPTSAKSVGMGDSFSAIDLDIQGAEYNPAAVAQMAGGELWLSHLSYLEGVNVEALQFARVLGPGALNFSTKYLRVKISERDSVGNDIGSFLVSDLLFGVAIFFQNI